MPLKIKLLAFFLFYVTGICYCQDTKDSALFATMPYRYIHLEYNNDSAKPALPFADVSVIDARGDTSCIGFNPPHLLPANRYKISFRNPACNEISNYIKDAYLLSKNDSAWNLVILLKKLWLSNAITIKSEQQGDDATWGAGIIFNAELFAEKNGVYHTLYRVDSTFAANYGVDISNCKNFVTESVKAMLSKAGKMPAAMLKMGKKNFTNTDITGYVNSMRNVISIISIPKKGVYKTFDEFVNNAPSITDYEIKLDKKADIMYVKDAAGSGYVLHDFWGYCDGQHFFINSAGNVFPIWRQGYTFNAYGFKALSRLKIQRVYNFLMFGVIGGLTRPDSKTITYKGERSPLQIDMTTGELF